MKLMFISDIHGSLFWLEQALAKVEEEQPHTLVILGTSYITVREIRCRTVIIPRSRNEA